MRTIILTYPEFQSLPRGVKQMLLATENFYFGEAESAAVKAEFVKSQVSHPTSLPVMTLPKSPAELRAAA